MWPGDSVDKGDSKKKIEGETKGNLFWNKTWYIYYICSQYWIFEGAKSVTSQELYIQHKFHHYYLNTYNARKCWPFKHLGIVFFTSQHMNVLSQIDRYLIT